ncbi:glycosyltransferase involved in cell wall biosynthesis [Pontibacter mucosus]|uniref:Glycosyltransferase involved in cell wall biosynthesis n=1 Tax=Pontibacter mucosus TaxID=1649266 RepID=A0A2T5YES6_9BACT|nr:glycosyltransferase family 4 protein [Pontibacter mucosus]PTX15215.1 glycosyltransferase involved in cell wall biosynthesis [Pontibacter mucosus]
MRVLHLVSEKTWRGGEQQVAYLIAELQQLGVSNYVACRKGSAFHEYCQRQSIPHSALPFANEFDVVTALRVKAYSRQHKLELMHVHSGHAHAISVLSHALGNTLPIILSRRVDFPVKNNLLSRLKYNYKGIRRVVCVSDKIKEVVSQSLDRPELCVTVYSGIDLSRFAGSAKTGKLHREFNLPPTSPLIGNISAIAPHKDYYTFIDTAELVLQQHPEARFFIIGDGPLRQDIESYARHKNLQDRVIFTGFRKDIPESMPELDVMLVTSETEGLGTTILDAFACRVPVVATRAGGIPEIVRDGVTGLLAPVKAPAELAQKVHEVLTNEQKRQQLIEGASRLLQEFSKRNTALRTLAIYQEVLGKV